MKRDEHRIGRVSRELHAAQLDAIVCAAPEHVLMLSGYWPVTGNSIAIVTKDGHVTVLSPADEADLARDGWADDVATFEPASLADLRSAGTVVPSALRRALERLNIGAGARLGYEAARASMRPASYVSQNVFGDSFWRTSMAGEWIECGELLTRLQQPMTAREIEQLRACCRATARAMERCAAEIRVGRTESEIAPALHDAFSTALDLDTHRAMCFAYCMSGPNADHAFAAYQRSRSRLLAAGDLVLVHCNSCVNGFWTDVTRTFVLGDPNQRQRLILAALFAAREAALNEIRAGVTGAAIDAAARGVMSAHGFEREFKHPTGHGVGFTAIDHNALPRIHPASQDVLEEGMVFNVEPGVYIEGLCGARHCDMVAVARDGCEVLTDFFDDPRSIVLVA